MEVSSALTIYRALNGLFCVYKPPRLVMRHMREMILRRITNELNQMETRPVSSRVLIDGSLAKGEDLTVKTVTNYADHPLVVGARYQIKDFKLQFAHTLGLISSGVVPIGIGKYGVRQAQRLIRQNPVRCYQITGRLGFATDTYDILGEVREKSTYGHISKTRIDLFLNKMEGNHQTYMFTSVGVDLGSQEAYDLASKGLLRPAHRKTMPIIYSIKCLDYKPPNFTVEVQCVNEWEVYLKRMIHEIGIGLKSNATCVSIRCARFGKYTADDSILVHQCQLENILKMINYHKKDQSISRPTIVDDYLDEDFDDCDEHLEDDEYLPQFKLDQDADGWRYDDDQEALDQLD